MKGDRNGYYGWAETAKWLRRFDAVQPGLKADLLDARRERWEGRVGLWTSMTDLLFTVPNPTPNPYSQDHVRVSGEDVTRNVLADSHLVFMLYNERGLLVHVVGCGVDKAPDVLDSFLLNLIGGE